MTQSHVESHLWDAATLHMAFERRQRRDYGKMAPLSQQVAEETLVDARTFVAGIKAYLHAKGQFADAQQEGE